MNAVQLDPKDMAMAMTVARDFFKGKQPLAAAIVYAELAQAGLSTPELWCGLGASLLRCRGQVVRKPFEVWAAKVFRRGAPMFGGTDYQSVVADLSAELSEASAWGALQDAEIGAMIEFLVVHERVLVEAVEALGADAAMTIIIALGDRASPVYVPLLRHAVEGNLGEGAARSALKRIGRFLDWPEMVASLLAARDAADAEELDPYLSSVLSRLPAGWDEPRRAACPPYRGLAGVDIELVTPGTDLDACAEALCTHLGAAPRDARSWLEFAPCMVKKGSPRVAALELREALQSLGASIAIHGYQESLARQAAIVAPPPPPPPAKKPWWKIW